MPPLRICFVCFLLVLVAPMAWSGLAHVTPLELDEAMASGVARTDPAFPRDVFVASGERLLRANVRTGAIVSLGNEEFPFAFEELELTDFRIAADARQVVALAEYQQAGDEESEPTRKALIAADLEGGPWRVLVASEFFHVEHEVQDQVQFVIQGDKAYVHSLTSQPADRYFELSLIGPPTPVAFVHHNNPAPAPETSDVSMYFSKSPHYLIIDFSFNIAPTLFFTGVYRLEKGIPPTFIGLQERFAPLIILPSDHMIGRLGSVSMSSNTFLKFTVNDEPVRLESLEVDPRNSYIFGTATPVAPPFTAMGFYRFPAIGGEGTLITKSESECNSVSILSFAQNQPRLAYACEEKIFVNADYLKVNAEHRLIVSMADRRSIANIQFSPDASHLLVETRQPDLSTDRADLAYFSLFPLDGGQPILLASGRTTHEFTETQPEQKFAAVMDPRSRTVAIAHLTSTNGGPFLGSELQVHSLLNPGDKAIIPIENLRQFGYTPGGDLWFIGEQP